MQPYRFPPPPRITGRRLVKWRAAYLARHPDCERCAESGRRRRAVEIHHPDPVAAGGAQLDDRNAVALCRACHLDVELPAMRARAEFHDRRRRRRG